MMHARIAVRELPEREHRAASPRVYIDCYMPSDRSENIGSPSQG
jgi:hypothetical protein